MQTSVNRLETIQQERRLPKINADVCVYSIFEKSTCNNCVDSCPTKAWILNEDELGLNVDSCDGCGHCTSACPSGALYIEYPWIIRQFSGHPIALFSCEKNNIKAKAKVLPCVHIIGIRQLLLIFNFGIRHLLIATSNCSECERYQSTNLAHQVRQLNILLLERSLPPIKLMQRSTRVWENIFGANKIISHGAILSRRDFLRGYGQQYRQQMLLENPLNLTECQSIPPGKLLPIVEKTDVHWPWSISLNQNTCNGCDACMNLCPTEALVYTPENEKSSATYNLDPANCNGCGICQSVCETNAISIHQFKKASSESIQLTVTKCVSCGNNFHLPKNEPNLTKSLCRVCNIYNHNKNLFQVMD